MTILEEMKGARILVDICGVVRIGEKVVIVGGGGIGIEIAPHLAQRSNLRPDIVSFLSENNALEDEDKWLLERGEGEITMTTRQNTIGGSIGSFTRWVLAREVDNSGINVMYGTTAENITDKGVVVAQNGKSELISADTILLAGGLVHDQKVYKSIKDSKIPGEIHALGESGSLNHAIDAVREAYELALRI